MNIRGLNLMLSIINYLNHIRYNKKDKYLYYLYNSTVAIRLYTLKRKHRRAYLYRESYSYHDNSELFFKSFREGYEELMKTAIKKNRSKGVIKYA